MNGVVIVAGGSGSRMGMSINKQFIKINDKETVAHTIEKFYQNNEIGEIVVVVKEEEKDFFEREIIEKYKFENIKIALSGKERQDSVYNGLNMINKDCDIVLIHDGARPFVTEEIINNSITEAKKHNAVVVGVPVKDTIKVINDNNEIESTPNRATLWAVQTPQTFRYDILMKAYNNAMENSVLGTDDATLVESIGYKVKMIVGSYNNIKITTKEDLDIGMQILKSQEK